MGVCEVCGKEESLPFKCAYCDQFFCAEHHLPENHECVDIWRAKRPERSYKSWLEQKEEEERSQLLSHVWDAPSTTEGRSGLSFSSTELLHLGIGTALVTLVGLSWLRFRWEPLPLTIAVVLFSLSFVLHELGHKFVAQVYGIWAEFRVDFMGAMMTLISVLLPFKIIAPGAVMMSGATELDTMGKTALVGPVINLVFASLLTFVQPLFPGISSVLRLGAYLNVFIALFNLIPFGMLDGKKVMAWNKYVWGVFFFSSLAAMIPFFLSGFA